MPHYLNIVICKKNNYLNFKQTCTYILHELAYILLALSVRRRNNSYNTNKSIVSVCTIEVTTTLHSRPLCNNNT